MTPPHSELIAELLERGVTHRPVCARIRSDYNLPCSCARASVLAALTRCGDDGERMPRTLLATLKLRPVEHRLRCMQRVVADRPCDCGRDELQRQLLRAAV